MHLNHSFSRYSLFVFYLLSGLSYRTFSQTKASISGIDRDLLSINQSVISLAIPHIGPCNIPTGIPFEDLLQKALLHDKQGNWPCCKRTLESIVKNEHHLSALQRCHFYLALSEYFTAHQSYDSANLYATLANTKAGEQHWQNEKASALLLLSRGGSMRRHISAAYAWADSALVIARQTGNEVLEGKILFQLALCVRRHFTAIAKRSFPYFLMAREKAIATADSVTLSTVDFYLGSDYFELNKWEDGLPYFKEGASLSVNTGNIYQAYLSCITVGYAFEVRERPREALILFIKALHVSQRQKEPYDIQHCYDDISRCYKALHQYDSALAYANLAASVQGVDPFWANSWDLKASIYDNMGNYKMAADMYKKSVEWYREDFLYRNQDQLSGYEAKLNTKEKELQVTQQKKRAVQLEWMAGGIGGLLVIAAWAFASQRKARRKLFLQNKLIEKQRSQLQKSLGEKEILLKEIHHRVKNNLSVISSLLELQSSGIDDETAKAAIAVGQNRVSSIALIHQRLYQHENLAAIELNGFLQDLLRQVSSIFKKPGTHLQTVINVPETLLDIDTAVPFGLIVNELLTNSYKYAFDGQREGLIKIDLQQNTDEFILTYADNGPGMAEGASLKNTTSIGLRLIHRLSKQLSGSATYKYENGSTFVIHFKDSNMRKHEE